MIQLSVSIDQIETPLQMFQILPKSEWNVSLSIKFRKSKSARVTFGHKK